MKNFKFFIVGIFLLMATVSLQAQENKEAKKAEDVDEMPIYPGCEANGDQAQKKACTEAALLKYVYQKLIYPTIAREKGIEGLVVVGFVVNKEGRIENVSIKKDIGGGCGEEVARVINSLNDSDTPWTPGKLDGKAVKVLYYFPVRFRLEGEEKKEKKRKWWQPKKN